MEKSYLIQRLQKPRNVEIKGVNIGEIFSFGGGMKNGGLSDKAMSLLRPIFSFDYMGSAEFEFGEVPKAFAKMAEQANKMNLVSGEVSAKKGETIYYLCIKEQKEDVEKTILALRKDEYSFHLKEHCGLGDYFDSEKEYHKMNLGWLELDNGFMFFVDTEMFKKTCDLFCAETGE